MTLSKSPITTLLGLAAGGAQLAAGGTGWKQILAALATAALGAFAKDEISLGK